MAAKAKHQNGARSGAQRKSARPAEDAIALLKADHRKVEGLFAKYAKSKKAEQKSELARQICQELIIHTMIEEEIFYPAVRAEVGDEALMNEAQVEHDSAKGLIIELLGGSPKDEFYDAKVTVLCEQIRHHVQEEEKRAEGMFAEAKAAGVDVKGLGAKIAQRKAELLARAKTGELPTPKRPSFQRSSGKEKGGEAQGVALLH